MTKAWWLGFPKLRCPHCGREIVGVKFEGRWMMPRKAKITASSLEELFESTGDVEREVTGP